MCAAIGIAMVAAPPLLAYLGLLNTTYVPTFAWVVAAMWAPTPISVPATLMSNISDDYRPGASSVRRAGLIFHLAKVAPVSTAVCAAMFAIAFTTAFA